ncbi:aldehyde dehydrogenase family protein [Aerococcus sanguinicola]|uniref:Putative aldehyde dehydrogenase AldA n=1 Tax=Aerococcus sanguinicola TaxID=119206 RepID=A0A0X8FAQ8_9LACT|nr:MULTISPECIES: aldehyde dehydrogenase family protein [Aerococcus]AMB93733.1 aldehyde dehydrogenase [Aerococcus sanguinicola]MDK7050418.1 aldehyde dehydrogenase family protein [Aerococcus sanguinicola]OFT94510.1 aldehyde dehydrogenase [Aerococcus sp. HMSC23C02]PKZ21537.1 aldehyde dehydrogenase [Aerococcus sanguinicola]
MEIKDLNLEKDYSLLINGEWTKGAGSDRIDVISPANGEHLATITDAVNEDVDRAVEAAQEAFKTWGQTDVKERASILNQIADLIDENAERLALIETLDNGKPIRETSGADIPLAADHFRYFASVIRSEEDQVKFLTHDTMSMIIREPIGVVGQIIPWNFPFLMAAWKLAPALAAGCVVVIKPASDTSLSLLELAKLINPILPKGVLNVITGRGSKAGDYLKHHKGLDKLAFTGSTAVGRDIGIAAAENLIPATLELGGKSANIFFEDMDMEQALEGAQLGILFNQGEVCSAGSRILVQESIYDEFIERLIEEFKQVKIGLPWDKETQLGAQANPSQHKKVDECVQIGLDEGAELLTGGQAVTSGDLDKGYYYEPTLLLAKNDMRVAQEEIFGPVATVIKFKDVDEAIQIANESDYGLGGGVFTTNLNTAFKVARGVRTGRVWINTYNSFEAGAPFGGYKDSGIGRETHKMILNAYTQAKNIYVNLGQGRTGMF